MLVRLVFSFIIGLIAAMPRDRSYIPINTTPPPGSGEPPTPDILPPGEDGDVFPPIDLDPAMPSVPPTPPPGYEGTWPPGSEVDHNVPPTPPPGFEGDWPGATGGGPGPIREQLRDLLGQIRLLLRSPGPLDQRPDAIEKVQDGADQLTRSIAVPNYRADA